MEGRSAMATQAHSVASTAQCNPSNCPRDQAGLAPAPCPRTWTDLMSEALRLLMLLGGLQSFKSVLVGSAGLLWMLLCNFWCVLSVWVGSSWFYWLLVVSSGLWWVALIRFCWALVCYGGFSQFPMVSSGFW